MTSSRIVLTAALPCGNAGGRGGHRRRVVGSYPLVQPGPAAGRAAARVDRCPRPSESTCFRRSTWWRSPRRSAVARLDPEGRLTALDLADADDDLVGPGSAPDRGVLAVDAPLAVPDETGRRDVEARPRLVRRPGLPGVAPPPGAASRRRPRRGARAARWPRPGASVREALPDLVLRQIAWERDHPAGRAAARPGRRTGRRGSACAPRCTAPRAPAGPGPAGLLAGVAPAGGGDRPRRMGAGRRRPTTGARSTTPPALDAICCAYTALRMADPEAAIVHRDAGAGAGGLPGRRPR